MIADHSLHLASAPNLRDIGGYRTSDGKWVKVGLLYRSDGLDVLTDADNAALQAIGVKLVCDLRTDEERTSKPDKEIAGSTNEHINIIGEDELVGQITAAITGGDTAAQEKFLGDGKAEQLLVDGGRALVSDANPLAQYKVFFDRIEDPDNLPTVMHCSAGKDRTGWASAAVLTALGVPKATVMEDYLASNEYLEGEEREDVDADGCAHRPLAHRAGAHRAAGVPRRQLRRGEGEVQDLRQVPRRDRRHQGGQAAAARRVPRRLGARRPRATGRCR